MSAKSNLIERLKFLNAAILLPQLIDVGIAQSEHNGIANLLRKGLGIVAFNILEDFVKERCVECLAEISSSGISFNNLSNELQEHTTLGVLSALQFQARFFKGDNTGYRSLIQDEAGNIYSTKSGTISLSSLSLVSNQSNIAPNDLTTILRAFGITGGWTTMKLISDQIGGGVPDLAFAFTNAAQRRHSAAHSASFQYQHTYLSNLKAEIIAICASLDILLTIRCRQIMKNPRVKLDSHDINEHLNFRFLEYANGAYRQTLTIGGRSSKNWAAIPLALTQLQPNLSFKKQFLIELNASRRIENWYS